MRAKSTNFMTVSSAIAILFEDFRLPIIGSFLPSPLNGIPQGWVGVVEDATQIPKSLFLLVFNGLVCLS